MYVCTRTICQFSTVEAVTAQWLETYEPCLLWFPSLLSQSKDNDLADVFFQPV